MSSPYVLVPIVTGAQLINVALPGKQPDCTQTSIPEDMTLFDPQLSGKQGTSIKVAQTRILHSLDLILPRCMTSIPCWADM